MLERSPTGMHLLQYRRLLCCQSTGQGIDSLHLLNGIWKTYKVPSCAFFKCNRTSHTITHTADEYLSRNNAAFKYYKYSTKTGRVYCISSDYGRTRHLSVKSWNTEDHDTKWETWKFSSILGGTLIGTIMLIGSVLQAAGDVTVIEEESEDSKRLENEPLVTGDEKEASRDDDRSISITAKQLSQCRDLVKEVRLKVGIPGLSVAVAVDGKTVWAEGFGYADVENRVPCTPETVLRIASISKPITMAGVARLWEQGLLDLDKPVQHYVPEFPEKTWNGEKVTITTRHLVSHLSGIRHYDRKVQRDPSKTVKDLLEEYSTSDGQSFQAWKITRDEDLYNKKQYDSITESLDMFKDDPLVDKPGNGVHYSSFGWTLISAVVEKVAKMPFEEYLKSVLDDLGLENTYLEKAEPLIYNRGRQYELRRGGRWVNCPYINVSYKWGAEGLLSNVLDLVKFGNAMLYSYQAGSYHDKSNSCVPPGYLKADTVKMLWTVVDPFRFRGDPRQVGMGWHIYDIKRQSVRGEETHRVISHLGGAVGGASALLIVPSKIKDYQGEERHASQKSKSVIVSMITNLDSNFVMGRLLPAALKIAFTLDDW